MGPGGGESAERGRLPYWPGLDGLRGVAVVAVLVYHHDVAWARGGFLGVSVFFTMSGFLITSLLVSEHGRSGAIRLGAFWGRRARRLAPAGLLALALAVVAARTAVPVEQRGEAVDDIRAALAYIANWHFVLADVPYADLVRVPSPVQHFWSLAIEEQFYLVFPLVAIVALRRSRAALGVVLAAVTVGSIALQLHIGAGDRVYYGTNTRAVELAIGGLLALALSCDVVRGQLARWRLADIGGVVGGLTLLVLLARTELATPGLYAGGFAAIAVVSSLVVVGAVHGTVVARLLSREPLVAIGKVSYGLYVFHLPVYLLLSPARTGLDGWPLLGLRLAATGVLAYLSYVLVELPIRQRRALPRVALALPSFAGAVAVVLLATTVVVRPVPADSQLAAASGTVTFVTAEPPAAPSAEAGARDAAAAPGEVGGPGVNPLSAEEGAAGEEGPSAVPARPMHILVVGDSTARANGLGLAAWGAKNGLLQVDVASDSGCTIVPGDRVKLREGVEYAAPHCDHVFDLAMGQAPAVDAVVVFIGSSQLADRQYFGDPRWRSVDDPQVAAAYTPALQTLLDRFRATGKPVLYADLPVPNWDLDSFFRDLGSPPLGSGPTTLNSAARTTVLNGLDAAVLSTRPDTRRVPYAELLAAREAALGRPLRGDGLHLDDASVADLADHGLVAALQSAYLAITSDPSSGIVAVPGTTWSTGG
jgi:peptidoglycan/LPS O-acetylase OafA/YrhL